MGTTEEMQKDNNAEESKILPGDGGDDSSNNNEIVNEEINELTTVNSDGDIDDGGNNTAVAAEAPSSTTKSTMDSVSSTKKRQREAEEGTKKSSNIEGGSSNMKKRKVGAKKNAASKSSKTSTGGNKKLSSRKSSLQQSKTAKKKNFVSTKRMKAKPKRTIIGNNSSEHMRLAVQEQMRHVLEEDKYSAIGSIVSDTDNSDDEIYYHVENSNNNNALTCPSSTSLPPNRRTSRIGRSEVKNAMYKCLLNVQNGITNNITHHSQTNSHRQADNHDIQDNGLFDLMITASNKKFATTSSVAVTDERSSSNRAAVAADDAKIKKGSKNRDIVKSTASATGSSYNLEKGEDANNSLVAKNDNGWTGSNNSIYEKRGQQYDSTTTSVPVASARDGETKKTASSAIDDEISDESLTLGEIDGPSIFGPTTGSSQTTWVECDKCKKWRRLRGVIDESKLPPRWYCSMNKNDPQRSRCSAPEEEYSDNTKVTKETITDIRTRKHIRVWVRRLQCQDSFKDSKLSSPLMQESNDNGSNNSGVSNSSTRSSNNSKRSTTATGTTTPSPQKGSNNNINDKNSASNSKHEIKTGGSNASINSTNSANSFSLNGQQPYEWLRCSSCGKWRSCLRLKDINTKTNNRETTLSNNSATASSGNGNGNKSVSGTDNNHNNAATASGNGESSNAAPWVEDRSREWYCVMNTWDEKIASCAAPQENLPALLCPPWVTQDEMN